MSAAKDSVGACSIFRIRGFAWAAASKALCAFSAVPGDNIFAFECITWQDRDREGLLLSAVSGFSTSDQICKCDTLLEYEQPVHARYLEEMWTMRAQRQRCVPLGTSEPSR
jgi:hypothetical protein